MVDGPPPVFISGVVEGDVDDAVARRLVLHVEAQVATIHVKHGKQPLLARLPGYNAAAQHSPWLVLVDLDHDAECVPAYLEECLPERAEGLCFRVAVREVEAWLLSDRHRIARFLSVPVRAVPAHPDGLDDPKGTIVSLASRSRRRAIRDDMVPRPGSGRKIGPAYTSRLIEFVGSRWRPDVAETQSESLARTVAALRDMVQRRRAMAADS